MLHRNSPHYACGDPNRAVSKQAQDCSRMVMIVDRGKASSFCLPICCVCITYPGDIAVDILIRSFQMPCARQAAHDKTTSEHTPNHHLAQLLMQAVTYFRRALKLSRHYLSAWTLMGHEYVEMKNPPAAIGEPSTHLKVVLWPSLLPCRCRSGICRWQSFTQDTNSLIAVYF